MTFDLTAHADALADMRRVQDEIDAEVRPLAEAIAEAKALIKVADRWRRAQFATLERREGDLARALDAVVVARAALDRATEVQIQALEALSILRGGDHHVIRRYVLADEVTQ
jgi:hypothetical protein